MIESQRYFTSPSMKVSSNFIQCGLEIPIDISVHLRIYERIYTSVGRGWYKEDVGDSVNHLAVRVRCFVRKHI